MKLLIAFGDYSYATYLKVASYFNRPIDAQQASDRNVVIFIPGVYENWFYFRLLAQSIPKHYSVQYADLLIGSKGTFEEQSVRLSSYINTLKSSNVVLIGHSSGGIIALLCLEQEPNKISRVINIASPYAGVFNGHLLRTKVVRQLLPNSPTIKKVQEINKASLKKVISISPEYDNQVWSKDGTVLDGTDNIQVKASGHHLILKSSRLHNVVSSFMSQ